MDTLSLGKLKKKKTYRRIGAQRSRKKQTIKEVKRKLEMRVVSTETEKTLADEPKKEAKPEWVKGIRKKANGRSSYLNQFFQSVDEAGHFFRAYALRNRFAIKIQVSHRNKDNEVYGRLYVCRLYGKTVVVVSSKNKRRREVLPKSECKVRMNVIKDERKKRFDISDTQAGLDLLHRLNEECGSKYFIRTEVNEENRLKYLVWIDLRCLMAYQNFDDVLAFDTTYGKNRYSLSFVPFTRVNHHYQSVIFRFALMRDEHASTFTWILHSWLEGMGNKPPMTIITDQDQTMANAIAEDRWESYVDKYHLQEHKWLNGLYELKRKWIIAYTRNTFSAFQNSTSRSEEMNSFFDNYVSSATGLKEFIENAEKALGRQLRGRRKKIM
ncbi:protein FAR1-RELATED SEQUENCE 5-like [Apium graveolens]|uniref:protein FAR1-RELATED SEQUENCE 5-like n=1 Tax=Apium graveolens TaxID=4045 RepID=UPI003D7B94D6